MPVYEYLCADCGPFVAIRPMAEFQQPQPCEECRKAAPRVLLTAPTMSGLDAARRRAGAVNERSANAPERVKRHSPSCRCCSGGGSGKLVAEPVAVAEFSIPIRVITAAVDFDVEPLFIFEDGEI